MPNDINDWYMHTHMHACMHACTHTRMMACMHTTPHTHTLHTYTRKLVSLAKYKITRVAGLSSDS